MVKYNLESAFFINQDYKKKAENLYGENGYVIVREFIAKEDVASIKKYFLSHNFESQMSQINKLKEFQKNNFFHYIAKYFYKNKMSSCTILNNCIKKVFDERNMICLQPNSDLFVLDYCQRNDISIDNLDNLYNHQFNHSFFRLAHYQDGEGQLWHKDNPGEIQAIIFLSEKHKDYTEGGLIIKNEDGTCLNVDDYVNEGDLVLLNSYKKLHMVEPVICKTNQIGRIHIFVPMIPDYLFPDVYFFDDNKYKLYFKYNPSYCYKISTYFKHFYQVIFNRKYTSPINNVEINYPYDAISYEISNMSYLLQHTNKKVYLAPFNAFTRTLYYNSNFKFVGFIDNFADMQGYDIFKFSKNLEYDYVVVLTQHQDVLDQFDKKKVIISKNNTLCKLLEGDE